MCGDLSLGMAILGAGASSRMGRPKLLLPWSRTTILGHLLRQWTDLGARQIAVVISFPESPISWELDRLSFPIESRIPNSQPDRGMFSSIQAAARWTGWNSAVTHWALVLGDQPHLKDESLARLINFAAEQPEKICQPMRDGRGRHPVILPRHAFGALGAFEGPTLKSFLLARESARAFMQVRDPAFDLDVDTPEDYERALKLSAQGK